MGIESTIEEIKNHNILAAQGIHKKLNKFQKAFNKEFKFDHILKVRAESLTWGLFSNIISLYAFGSNSSVIVEIYSILEKFTIRDFPRLLTNDAKAKNILKNLVERKNLIDIAPYLVEIDVWNADDLNHIKNLVKIRNGIAHKNESLISKSINSGKETHYLDIDSIVGKFDTLNFIIRAINLLLKLSYKVQNL